MSAEVLYATEIVREKHFQKGCGTVKMESKGRPRGEIGKVAPAASQVVTKAALSAAAGDQKGKSCGEKKGQEELREKVR